MIERMAAQFNAGGPFMWVILGVLGAAAAVMIERYVYLLYAGAGARSVAADMLTAIREDRIDDAQRLATRRSSPLFRLLAAAMERYAQGRSIDEVRQGVEQEAIQEAPRLSHRLNYLSLFANIATLLGLLGTIAGLQVSFSSLASADAAQKATLLASGIAQAMNTTAFGLIVAVPCMVAYTMLTNKQQALMRDMDDAVVRVVNGMKTERA